MAKRRFYFNIDVLGACNLRCPSCPTGNMPDSYRLKGLMEPELLDKILDKAVGECEVKGVGLFNWTEPLLHPRLPELVRAVTRRNLPCDLSANLNVIKNVEAVLKENPHSIRMSMSGFTQEKYGYTHRGGDVERVKENMATLAALKEKTGASTEVHVLYHRYKTNLDDELLAREYAQSLGFEFVAVWAMMMPIEKVLSYAQGNSEFATLTDDDRKLIEHLALPLGEALQAGQRQNARSCTLQDDQMTLDHRGDVALCCGVYDIRKFRVGSYLDLSVEELQERKYRQEICNSCMGCGAHVYTTYGSSELDRIAEANIDPKYAKVLGLGRERMRKTLRNAAKKVYYTVGASWLTPAKVKNLGRRGRRILGGIRNVFGRKSSQ